MAYLNSYSISDTPPDSPDLLTTATPAHILDEALTHLATAIATLQRAGALYSAHIEPFWHFAAGTESELDYKHQVSQASTSLPEKICVRQDVRAGIEELKKAVLLLREFGDVRDAHELKDVVWNFLRNVDEEW